ncbi:MAG: hypothetical protein Q8R97_04670 [Brevundimonas sp.]|jgi:hypothetical protein|nr:hypothetical protein [Brevundimonas sp.]
MARATIEIHDRSEDAFSAVEDLRAVGLGDASVASLVMAAEPSSEPTSETRRSPDAGPRSVQASIPGIGLSIITGWLVDELPHAPDLNAEAWLRRLLERARPSDKDIERVVAALHGRGGLVSVCSDDRIGSVPTINEVLKGRGA